MREPKIFTRKRRHVTTYYVQIGPQQINLGTDKTEAQKEYHRLLANRQAPTPRTPMVALIDRFLTGLERTAKARRTYLWYKHHLDSFRAWLESRHNGKLTINQLTGDTVQEWLDVMYKDSGDNWRLAAIRTVSKVCNWAVDDLGIIDRNPIRKMKRPEYQPRECYVSPQDWQKFLAETKGPFRDIALFLRLTGCRPVEACSAEVRHFDREKRRLVFERSESKGKKRNRVIPLVGEALEIVQRRSLAAGEGPIFKTQRGAAWSNSSLNSCFDNVSKRSKVDLFPYILRHSFVSDQLDAGMDPVTLARIVGHRDIKMISQCYDNRDSDRLREALERTNVA
jgi:integrase/recombinase XerD